MKLILLAFVALSPVGLILLGCSHSLWFSLVVRELPMWAAFHAFEESGYALFLGCLVYLGVLFMAWRKMT
jgi:hypothetical protein